MHDTDRRVVYTKKILRSSLMKLLEEKPISRISVTELCTAAGINRGTFYSHYRQPEDVLRQIEDDLVDDIEKVLGTENDMKAIHCSMLRMLELNRSACRVLLGPNGGSDCVQRVLEISAKYFKNTWQTPLNLSDDSVKYLSSFIFAGTIQVLKDWLLNDDGHTADEMAEIINRIQRQILQN